MVLLRRITVGPGGGFGPQKQRRIKSHEAVKYAGAKNVRKSRTEAEFMEMVSPLRSAAPSDGDGIIGVVEGSLRTSLSKLGEEGEVEDSFSRQIVKT